MSVVLIVIIYIYEFCRITSWLLSEKSFLLITTREGCFARKYTLYLFQNKITSIKMQNRLTLYRKCFLIHFSLKFVIAYRCVCGSIFHVMKFKETNQHYREVSLSQSNSRSRGVKIPSVPLSMKVILYNFQHKEARVNMKLLFIYAGHPQKTLTSKFSRSQRIGISQLKAVSYH